MTTKLEDQITKDEACAACERCLEESRTDSGEMVLTVAKELAVPSFFGMIHGGAMVMIEVPLDIGHALINDEDTVDCAWARHDLMGECLTITHQCPEHPEDPTDRTTYVFTSVRR